MVRPRRGTGAAGSKRLCAPLVGAEPPAAGRGFVDRTANDRMPEAKAARHVRLADEIELEKLVDCFHRRRLGPFSCRGRELRLERVARDRRTLEDASSIVRQRGELLAQRSGDGNRYADARQGALACRRRPGRPGELLEVEGVAAALFVDARDIDLFAEQLPSLVARHRADLDPGHLRGTVPSLERG